ncbi:MAG: MMPL family transporter [Actinobacteria bacterium]|nr:MMPL family transporter [Actinomycetota bacterium]
MERWTRLVLRHRWPVIGAWLAVLLVGGYLSSGLSKLLSNEFTVPGTDSEDARTILAERFGQRDDGSFLVIFRVDDSEDPATRRRLEAALERGADAVEGGQAQPPQVAGAHVVVGTIGSPLDLTGGKEATPAVREAVGQTPGVETFVSGTPAIQADLDPIFADDLLKGEAIALPIALAVLLAVFGLSFAVLMPFLIAATTISATLGIVWITAHYLTTAVYVTNLVQLIGLGIAIDYSLLIVYRFREQLARGESKDEAIVRTMATAGRAVVFSGATVAIGLALLLFMPVPFMRSMGLGGFLIPLVSIIAAVTLQPALLSVFGRRGMKRVHVADFFRDRLRLPLPRLAGTADVERGMWARLARSIMRRPLVYLGIGATALVAAAVPAFDIQLTPGSASGTPQFPESIRGFNVLRDALGPGALAPTQIVIDAGAPGAVRKPELQRAIDSFIREARRDREVARVDYEPAPPFVDPTGRYAYVSLAGRHEYGEPAAQDFARRLRKDILPSVTFPAGTRVLAGGGPAQGIDFIDRAYGAFPWLVLAVLLLTYITLLRAFRSLLLPLKAVLLNLLAIGATYGLLVIVFKYGIGAGLLGLYQFDQVEGWIPIFLFAMLFGLSMDYEVFLVSRMREFWDEGLSNEEAVAQGLERTGRIVTAAAIVMVAAFSGFAAGSIVGLQEFGLGLAIAIFIDATLVRAVLVPALMRLFGRYNWWLPTGVARFVRVAPSPLVESPNR